MNSDTNIIDAAVAADEHAQRSIQWVYDRLGYCTASQFKNVLAKIGKGEAAARRNYRLKLAVERITNLPASNFVSSAIEWGVAQEPVARMAVEVRTGVVIEEVGFIHHPIIEMCGGSPDGLIDDDGGWEGKCPFESAIHIETLLAGEMPPEHMAQVQGCMWITGRKWWLFSSFDPRLPKALQLFTKKIERDDAYIATLEAEVVKFLAEVKAALEQMQEKLKEYAE